jgi:hypothetical protein
MPIIAVSLNEGQFSLKHLQAELLRIDLLISSAVRRWQLAGQDPKDQFLGLYISPDEAAALANRPLGSNWGSNISLPTGEAQSFEAATREARAQVEQIIEQAQIRSFRLRLSYLKTAFGLSAFELDAFLICLAPALDLRYERLYGFLQNDITHKLPGVELILNLLLPAGIERLQYLDSFRDHAPLIRSQLLARADAPAGNAVSLLKQDLYVPPEIVSWLLGEYRPGKDLAPALSLVCVEAAADKTGSQAAGPDWLTLTASRPVLAFYGPDEALLMNNARQISARLQKPLLVFDLNGLPAAQEFSLPAAFRLALRDALLEGALPCVTGWENALNAEGVVSESVLAELDSFPDMVILCSARPWRTRGGKLASGRPLLWWSFTLPSTTERRQIWEQALGAVQGVSAEAVNLLAGQFSLTTGQIEGAVWAAKNTAFQGGRALTAEDLFEAARLHSSHHLDNLAVKIEPRYRWEDIVLPGDETLVLREIVSTVRDRPLVLESWGLGEKLVASTGISALFAGPPGTGKTLAAQVIAAELGMDIYKVDLSSIVSKFIGETEKNLERIFSQARNSNAILFFDEADAIFGKRSEVKDAHDRYANIEVGYLLQRMETYDGVVILATNLRSNLDEAFTRRLQFVVDFPFPDEAQRLEIWGVLFPPGVPRENDLDFDRFAKRFKLAGGGIRNVIVSAAFLAASEAAPVGPRHLLHGVRRELQKMGRLINEQDLRIEE